MPEDIRLSPHTVSLLAAFVSDPAEWRYGYDLSCETELKSGTLYPILMRLAQRGWLETRWERAQENGKPRHMYRLTTPARAQARALLKSPVAVRQLRPALRER